MEELFITEDELEYFTDIPMVVSEEAFPLKRKMSFEEAVKACNGITLEEFSRNIGDAIKRLIPNP